MAQVPPSSEQQIELTDDFELADSVTAPAVGDAAATDPYIQFRAPSDHVVAVPAGCKVVPHLVDANGDKLDSSTRVRIQKADRRGNPIGEAINLSELLGNFSYEDMAADPDFARRTQRDIVLDEKEYLNVYVEVPSGKNALDTDKSYFSLGDNTRRGEESVRVKHKDAMSEEHKQAVKANSGN